MTTQSKNVQQLQPKGYTDLTNTQRAHVDAYIAALARGQQTEITHAVKYWVEEARGYIKSIETFNKMKPVPVRLGWEDTPGALPRVQLMEAWSRARVRHALAMIVDATVRPTLDD